MKKKYGVEWKWNRDFLYTAVVLSYKEGTFEIDYDAYRKMIRYFLQPKFVDAGGALIVNPEAGEVFYLDAEEKKNIIKIALEETKGKVPVFSGCSHVTTEGTVREAVAAKQLGVDGIFFIPPMGSGDVTYAWNPDLYPEVWIDMMKAIADATKLPMIVHPTCPFTPRFGIGLPLSATLKACQAVPNIIGWKMTYNFPGWRTIADGLRTLDHHVGVLGAPCDLWHVALLNEQFDGTVNGAFCYAMEPMIDHIQAWKRNDLVEARRLWKGGLEKLQDYVYSDFARLHIRYKIGAWLRGLVPTPFMRPPQPNPMVDECKVMYEDLKALKLEVISEEQFKKVVEALPRHAAAATASN
jgi:4-hydroxy-tetrahydrodipicolinate synthase